MKSRVRRTSDVIEAFDTVSATRKLMSVGFILGLTASMPLRILTQSVNVPVRGRFPLPTFPGLSDPEMGWVEYLSRAESRMSKAWALFAKELEDEAGEEAWRAVIDAVHAVTTLAWGKVVRSHAGLKRVVSLLEREGIVKIASEFGNVESLHTN